MEHSGASWKLRNATPDDCRLYWEWANDPAVRAASFREEAIPWESHREWFAAKLESPDSLLFLLEDGSGCPVGQIRFDRTQGREFEIDISIAPDRRSAGIGRTLLLLGIERVRGEMAESVFVAKVKTVNAASLAIFQASGFERIETTPSEGGEFEKLINRNG